MTKIFVKLTFISSFILFSGFCNAATIQWEAMINGAQEVPSNASSASGVGVGTLDTVSGLLAWDISWTGLTPVAMHFHGPAVPGSNAGVQVNIGAISGLLSASIGSDTIDTAEVSDVLAGLWYINIHSANFPAGEIRGQVMVTAIPEPTVMSLIIIGFGGLLACRRNRIVTG